MIFKTTKRQHLIACLRGFQSEYKRRSKFSLMVNCPPLVTACDEAHAGCGERGYENTGVEWFFIQLSQAGRRFWRH